MFYKNFITFLNWKARRVGEPRALEQNDNDSNNTHYND